MGSSRFDIPIEDLERTARVADPAQVQVQEQALPRLHEPLRTGVHPHGDGATPDDGDGD